MKFGDILRYSKSLQRDVQTVDDLPNFAFETNFPGLPRVLLERGISPIGRTRGPGGTWRRPAILISSSPHKVGSAQTPWHDIFDPDFGHIKYYGDAKTPGENPNLKPGNKTLLAAYDMYSALGESERVLAPPSIFFQRVSVRGAVKGHVRFQGVGLINRVELVTQISARTNTTFSNYAFDFTILDLSRESERFDWAWINDRRSQSVSASGSLKSAPASWKLWVKRGAENLPRLTRRVSKLAVAKKKSQLPDERSRDHMRLRKIYGFYDGRKQRFEGLAYVVAKRLLSSPGHRVVEGWITPSSADGGADFICRLDIGKEFSTVKQVVYGQAKCTRITSAVDGKDIARTVARLKRGWFGVFVTTSYFSEAVQREVIEDQYPVMLVNGKTLSETVGQMMIEGGYGEVDQFLVQIDSEFTDLIARRRPDEILFF